jgi:hypothetical protein
MNKRKSKKTINRIWVLIFYTCKLLFRFTLPHPHDHFLYFFSSIFLCFLVFSYSSFLTILYKKNKKKYISHLSHRIASSVLPKRLLLYPFILFLLFRVEQHQKIQEKSKATNSKHPSALLTLYFFLISPCFVYFSLKSCSCLSLSFFFYFGAIPFPLPFLLVWKINEFLFTRKRIFIFPLSWMFLVFFFYFIF